MAAEDPLSKNSGYILVVDDSTMNRMLLQEILGDEYHILEAADGVEAVNILEERSDEIILVVLDINMPRMDGFEVLAVMNQRNWIQNIAVITISAEDSLSYIERTYDLGVTDYINRPFDARTVKRRVDNTVALYAKQRRLADMVSSQIFEKEQNTSLLVNILSHIVEFRNGESGLHILHIGTLTEILARRLAQKTDRYDLTPARRSMITTASALHDIGKISIPDEVLNKPGRLTDEEFEQMKQHTTIGYDMLSNLPIGQDSELVSVAREIVRWHHERYDGRGYPDGLEGDDIPIGAQLVSLADVYDALSSPRCYKPAFEHDKVMDMILNGECGAFNPLLLECLVEAQDQICEELKVLSPSQSNAREMERLLAEVEENQDLSVLNSAMELLEIERQKYNFASQTSQELQFEYMSSTDVLELPEFTATALCVPQSIQDPRHSPELAAALQDDGLAKIVKLLEAASPQDPTVHAGCTAVVNGMPQEMALVARTLWPHAGGEGRTCLGVVGKLLPIAVAV